MDNAFSTIGRNPEFYKDDGRASCWNTIRKYPFHPGTETFPIHFREGFHPCDLLIIPAATASLLYSRAVFKAGCLSFLASEKGEPAAHSVKDTTNEILSTKRTVFRPLCSFCETFPSSLPRFHTVSQDNYRECPYQRTRDFDSSWWLKERWIEVIFQSLI